LTPSGCPSASLSFGISCQRCSWQDPGAFNIFHNFAAENGMMLWSLTPLLAHSGQPIDRLYYYQEGHWTAAAHEMAAHFMSRLIQSRLLERRQLMNKSRE